MELRFQRDGAASTNISVSTNPRFEMRSVIILAMTAAMFAGASAQGQDSAFAAMQKRGKQAMGVDQYTSTHKFDALPDGGRIELQRDTRDSAGVAAIRAHLRDIAVSFKRGDFSNPVLVHMREVPGTRVMAAKRSVITYESYNLPLGAELRIRTADRAALAAIHEFMAFQRSDHHAGGQMGHAPKG